MKKVAVRNIRLCTKDCLCLYVCPTGATDTENSIIDVNKCVGCGMCADSCPSKAISLVPTEYPAQQQKQDDVISSLNALSSNKMKVATIAKQIAQSTENISLKKLMLAISKSCGLIAEDLLRESGYMLPQSANTHDFLEGLVKNPPTADFPIDIAKQLVNSLDNNEES